MFYEQFAFSSEAASALLRMSLGLFFLFSGYHKIFNKDRRATLEQTFKGDGVYNPAMMWVIPLAETFGGLALLIGFMTRLADVGLIAVCLGACAFDGMKRIKAWKPLDKADAVDDLLYLPEALYIVMLTVLFLVGAGSFSIDAVIASLL